MMSIMYRESITIASRALLANNLRSTLTMPVIIIGVGAVIAMVSIGMGVREKVQKSIASLGSTGEQYAYCHSGSCCLPRGCVRLPAAAPP